MSRRPALLAAALLTAALPALTAPGAPVRAASPVATGGHLGAAPAGPGAATARGLAVGAAPVAGTGPGVPVPAPPAEAATPRGDSSGSVTLEPVVGEDDAPNLVVLMTDDMRDDDLRFMPNVQRLFGGQGVRFTNSFSPLPLCCPARASFLSGQYAHNHGVWSHLPPYGFAAFDDRSTLPVWLQRLGYHTTFLGKYLNGYGRQPQPDGGSSLRYVPPGWNDWRGAVDGAAIEAPELDGGTYRYFDTTLNDNGRLQPHQGRYQTLLLSRGTQQSIRAGARSPAPFFVWTSFVAPHVGRPHESDDPRDVLRPDGSRDGFPTAGRPKYVRGMFDEQITRIPGRTDEDVRGKPFFVRHSAPMTAEEQQAVLTAFRQRVEALRVVDDEVAKIVATLDETGELDNTYVVFTSDNGFFLGEHRRRSGKILPYEPSLRVPLFLRGPGIPAGETREDPFLTIDLGATLVQAAGGAVPDQVDGVGMLDVARDGDRGWDRPVLTDTGPRRLLLDGSGGAPDSSQILHRPLGPSLQRFSQGVRTGDYLYVEHASRERELYDLHTDPQQLHNVVGDPGLRAVVARLAATLQRLRDCAGRECSEPLRRPLRTDRPAPAYVVPAS